MIYLSNMRYTNEEIQKNIRILENKVDKLKIQRTELSQNINSLKNK